jgi:hypothetical protein
VTCYDGKSLRKVIQPADANDLSAWPPAIFGLPQRVSLTLNTPIWGIPTTINMIKNCSYPLGFT